MLMHCLSCTLLRFIVAVANTRKPVAPSGHSLQSKQTRGTMPQRPRDGVSNAACRTHTPTPLDFSCGSHHPSLLPTTSLSCLVPTDPNPASYNILLVVLFCTGTHTHQTCPRLIAPRWAPRPSCCCRRSSCNRSNRTPPPPSHPPGSRARAAPPAPSCVPSC